MVMFSHAPASRQRVICVTACMQELRGSADATYTSRHPVSLVDPRKIATNCNCSMNTKGNKKLGLSDACRFEKAYCTLLQQIAVGFNTLVLRICSSRYLQFSPSEQGRNTIVWLFMRRVCCRDIVRSSCWHSLLGLLQTITRIVTTAISHSAADAYVQHQNTTPSKLTTPQQNSNHR